MAIVSKGTYKGRGWTTVVAVGLVLALLTAACGSTERRNRQDQAQDGAPVIEDTEPGATLDGTEEEQPREIAAEQDAAASSGPTNTRQAQDSQVTQQEGQDQQDSQDAAEGTQQDPAVSESGDEPAPQQAAGPLKIGVAIGEGNPGHVIGIDASQDPERNRQWIQAMVEEVNATGGFAGREIEVVVHEVNQGDSTQTAQTREQNEACVAFAEDHEVFMVLSTVRMYWAQDCYADHELPMLERHYSNSDDHRMAELDPWILPSFWLTPTRMARLMPVVFEEEQFLTDDMGIISYEYPDLRRAVENELVPRLEERGGTVRETVFMQVTYDAVAQGISSAVLRFRTMGIDRVIMFAPGGGALAIFAQEAQSQNYNPRYGVSTYDQITVVEPALPPGQMHDLVGVGFLETLDVSVPRQSDPGARERDCWDVMNRRGGFDYRDRSAEANRAGVICELFWLPQAALEPVTGRPLRPAEIRSHLDSLGNSYQPVQFPKSIFGPAKYDGIGAYTHMAFDEERNHFIYSKPWRDIPRLGP